MTLSGIAKDVASTSTFQTKINVVLTSLQQQLGRPNFENNVERKVERSINLIKLLPEGSKEKVADIMRLVGCENSETKAGKVMPMISF